MDSFFISDEMLKRIDRLRNVDGMEGFLYGGMRMDGPVRFEYEIRTAEGGLRIGFELRPAPKWDVW